MPRIMRAGHAISRMRRTPSDRGRPPARREDDPSPQSLTTRWRCASPSAMRGSCATSPHGTSGCGGTADIGWSRIRLAFDYARVVCREAAGERNNRRVRPLSPSAKTVAAVECMASADRCIAATIDQWDANPWLLNTPDGVIDLCTGNMRAHSPLDYMTKMTAVPPRGDCPTFMAFLHRVMNGANRSSLIFVGCSATP